MLKLSPFLLLVELVLTSPFFALLKNFYNSFFEFYDFLTLAFEITVAARD